MTPISTNTNVLVFGCIVHENKDKKVKKENSSLKVYLTRFLQTSTCTAQLCKEHTFETAKKWHQCTSR